MFRYKSVEEIQKAAEKEGVFLPFAKTAEALCTPIQTATLSLKNRMAIQPMEGCDGTRDGKPDELTLRRYDRFAASGAGLIWEEATADSGNLHERERVCPENHHAGHSLRPLQQA